MRTSTIYTIGTALSRAQGGDVSVDVLVNGQWLHGAVSAVDSHGVVLHGDDDVLSVLRMDSIDAVQIRQAAAFEASPGVETTRTGATVHPMPATGATEPWHQPTVSYKYGGEHAPETAQPVIVPPPRTPVRPTVGPIVAPSPAPDAGLHTLLRPRRDLGMAEVVALDTVVGLDAEIEPELEEAPAS